MKKISSGFAPIIVVLILGIIAVAAYLTLKPQTPNLYPSPTPIQTPDSTANLSRDEVLRDWKTYTNTKLDYSFKYPPFNSSVEDATNEVLIKFSLFENDPYLYSLFITYKFTVDLSKLSACNSDSKLQCLDTNYQRGKVEEIALGETKAKSFYVSDPQVPESTQRFAQISEPFEIELMTRILSGGIDPAFDQILSTLKFLEATPTTTSSPTPSS